MARRSLSNVRWDRPVPGTSFDAAGLIALADIQTISRRTILIGTAPLLDALVICPGIHFQQKAADLSKAELPPTAALTSGYVFRVENQATVVYLQSIGITGHLITLSVENIQQGFWRRLWTNLFGPSDSILSIALVVIASLFTIGFTAFLAIIEDWWGFSIISTLVFARFLNICLIRIRVKSSWHGALEPGVNGDLLILLSQDRWIRMQGSVDALKTVTSGQWLREMSFWGNSLEAIATILVYGCAALAGNATQSGEILLLILLLGSAGLLGISNKQEKVLHLHGHRVRVKGKPKVYARRLDLAKELIKETKRHDWAVGLGMVKAEDYGETKNAETVTL